MILYLFIIVGSMFLIALGVSIGYQTAYLETLGFTGLAVLIILCIDGLTATVARILPKKCADRTKKCFQVSAKEKKLYEKMKIRAWKELIPEIGHLTGFRKNKIDQPKNVEYLDRFLLECCYGEIGHCSSVFTGFLTLLFFPLTEIWIAIAIPVAIVSAILNVLPIFVLRYNAYKLEILRKSVLKKQERMENETLL